VHQQTECQPVDAASDSDMNDVADSSDVLQYVTNSSRLGADDSQLIVGTAEPMSSSSSSYKVFVSGNPGECVGECTDDVLTASVRVTFTVSAKRFYHLSKKN